jgi:hypothetical protein
MGNKPPITPNSQEENAQSGYPPKTSEKLKAQTKKGKVQKLKTNRADWVSNITNF